jgi:prepilin-type N-terminal cleavage/methylation domain-containing protein
MPTILLKGLLGIMKRRAFTLVELLIVVIIIAVIASIAIPRFHHAQQRSWEIAVKKQIRLLREGVEKFRADTGRMPAQLIDLAATTSPAQGYNNGGNLTTLKGFQGPYISNYDSAKYSGWIEYRTTQPGLGDVFCPRPGNDLDGVPYSQW